MDSARFINIYLASGFSCFQALSTPAHTLREPLARLSESVGSKMPMEISMIRVKFFIQMSIGLFIILCLLVGCSGSTVQTPTPKLWNLVAIGDSIVYNPEQACPGCTGFVDRYATAISQATAHPVEVQNLSVPRLQIDGLLEMMEFRDSLRVALANADIIVVGISFNDIAWLRQDDPCDGPTMNEPDWSQFNKICATAAAEIFRPKFESLFAQIVALREGKPTIFRTINRYNDWIGWTDGNVPPEANNATRDVLDAWNAMVCKAAQENEFVCADIYHAFNGSDGLTPSLDLLAKDYTHPSDKGNEVIAGVLENLGYAPLFP